MKKNGRYDVSDLPEAQFEPGSNEQVLKNRLGIKSPKEMDDTEARALERAIVELVSRYNETIAEENKQEYFAAVQTGLDRNYGPMERLFARIIERSLASS